MPIEFPSYDEVLERIRSDIRGKLPDVDPSIFGSFMRALADSLGSRVFDAYLLEEQILQEFFPQTASGVFLERWGAIVFITRNPATSATGQVLFSGASGSVIPISTVIKSGNIEYTTSATIDISPLSSSITSLTQNAGLVTAVSSGHSFATGSTVTISGATQTEYNGSFEVTVIDANTFTYSILENPASPATGNIISTINGALVDITSTLFGSSNNLESGAVLTLSTPITGINTTAFVRNAGVTGGTDQETDDALRVRVLDRLANPVANFNEAQIESRARSVSGVTRVWIQPITPAVGSVTIYFVRDNEPNIIPDANEVAAVKSAILLDLQASSDPVSVFVFAPTPVETSYEFASISPDTPTMRAAIEANIIAFYEDRATLGQDVTQDQYRSAIQETQDTETGDRLQSFTLTSPVGDIVINDGELGQFGGITIA